MATKTSHRRTARNVRRRQLADVLCREQALQLELELTAVQAGPSNGQESR